MHFICNIRLTFKESLRFLTSFPFYFDLTMFPIYLLFIANDFYICFRVQVKFPLVTLFTCPFAVRYLTFVDSWTTSVEIFLLLHKIRS